eukprot:355525_1
MSCGVAQNLCIDKMNRLWVSGNNSNGDLGIGNTEFLKKPLKHPFFSKQKIAKICCGAYHSICVDDKGLCYIFGLNSRGQIGTITNGVQGWNIRLPQLFQSMSICNNNNHHISLNQVIVQQIDAGHEHSLVLTKKNDLFGFGDDSFGQVSFRQWTHGNHKSIRNPYLVNKEDIGINDNC